MDPFAQCLNFLFYLYLVILKSFKFPSQACIKIIMRDKVKLIYSTNKQPTSTLMSILRWDFRAFISTE